MAPKGESMEGRLSRTEEWIEGHEQRCEDRYRGIQDAITDMRGILKGLARGAVALLIGIIGWLLVQLYTANQSRLNALEHAAPPPVTVVQSAPR